MSDIVPTQSAGLMPAMSIQNAIARYNAVVEFTKTIMKDGRDYGTIPGAGTKPTLLKPGAEKLCSLFALAPEFKAVDKIIDFDKPLFYIQYECRLYRSGELVGTGLGSCNSQEKKYRYRQAERICPNCHKATIIKGKQEYGGGWICFAKKGGCGAKFDENAPAIVDQQTGQVENPDIADLLNTIDKMAQKRSLVAATLIATNASEFYTQDIEDIIDGSFVDAPMPITPTSAPSAQHSQPPAPQQQPRREPTKTLPAILVDLKICENIPAAAALSNKLGLAGMPQEDAIARARLYRAWRDAGADTDAAADNAIEGVPLP